MKERRGSKLHGSDKSLFSGEFWLAQKAIDLGLADRIGDLRSTLRERFGEKVHTPLISAERSLFGADHRASVSRTRSPTNQVSLMISSRRWKFVRSGRGMGSSSTQPFIRNEFLRSKDERRCAATGPLAPEPIRPENAAFATDSSAVEIRSELRLCRRFYFRHWSNGRSPLWAEP